MGVKPEVANEMAKWVWAHEHPFLYAGIEIMTSTVAHLYIAWKIMQVIVKYFDSRSKTRKGKF